MRKIDTAISSARAVRVEAENQRELASVRLVCAGLTLALIALASRVLSLW